MFDQHNALAIENRKWLLDFIFQTMLSICNSLEIE